MTLFDRKFGKDFLASIPVEPGVYFFYDEHGTLLYVGKAKSLRRRLTQYRKPRRGKRSRKMRALVREASRIEWRTTPSELEACLEELRAIQSLKPTRNIVGTFTFLYPFVGMREIGTNVAFCFTTLPEGFPGFTFFGAFRSRDTTADAFFALMRLLTYVGHPVPRHTLGIAALPSYSYLFGFRRLAPEWREHCAGFFLGASPAMLEALVMKLLDNAGARARAAEIQEEVTRLEIFWRREAVPLRKVIARTAYPEYPVAPKERDLLFVRAGFLDTEPETGEALE
jgi:excinuclease ABC subunit C